MKKINKTKYKDVRKFIENYNKKNYPDKFYQLCERDNVLYMNYRVDSGAYYSIIEKRYEMGKLTFETGNKNYLLYS